MAEGDHQDLAIRQGGMMVEIDAEAICGIIRLNCSCSAEQAARAANRIVDYLTATMLATGQVEDVTNPTGELQ